MFFDKYVYIDLAPLKYAFQIIVVNFDLILSCCMNMPINNRPAAVSTTQQAALLKEIAFNADGLVAAVVQDATTNEFLMMAWMDETAFLRTLETGKACFYSRSRKTAWMKGESSGHLQIVREVLVDCDGDVVLLKVDSIGGMACHTGRRNCFFRKLENGAWVTQFEPIKSQTEIYGE
jgi:phosphoribosyl-AMP cyclohydrolase